MRVHDCTALDCSLLRLYGLHSAHTQYVYFESVSVRVTVYGLSFFLIDVLYGCMRTVTDSCCIDWFMVTLCFTGTGFTELCIAHTCGVRARCLSQTQSINYECVLNTLRLYVGVLRSYDLSTALLSSEAHVEFHRHSTSSKRFTL